MQTSRVHNERQLTEFLALDGGVPLRPDSPSVRDADEHWLVQGADSAPLARCSLWYTAAPSYSPHVIGLIGHFAAADDEAAALLLETACCSLADHGCSLAAGPVDGSTFRNYRFVTERAFGGVQHPPFFLEPDNPDAWPLYFGSAGFQPLATYVSSWGKLPTSDPRLPALTERAADAGITVRIADMDAFPAELERIYDIVVDSFGDNFLYTPIDRHEFLTQYAQVQPYVRPEHVLIAEQNMEPVGFIFTVPDLSQQLRGEPVDTLVIKTVAVRPQVAGHGLGSLLGARVQAAAHALGFRNVIHALMHETNRSRNISRHYASPMRRYALFAKELAR